jgi:hypothetical protein
MGTVQNTFQSQFSKNHLLENSFFPKQHFLTDKLIFKFLHFMDNSKKEKFPGEYNVFKIYLLVQYLNKLFQNLYLPGQNITTHESLSLWKGRLSFKKYINLKGDNLV